jgi:tRNA modification GTPase
VIAGRPNAGKSTLLNRLAGHEAAIVSELPGTTRDVLRERILLDGLPLQILDTAGLRAAGADHAGRPGHTPGDAPAADPIEAEGMRRAAAAMTRADHILFVIDAAEDPQGAAYQAERARLPAAVPVTLVFNKLDRLGASPALPTAALQLSALTGAGMEALVAHLKACAGWTDSEGTLPAGPGDGGVIAARARHLEALERVAAHVQEAQRQLAARRAPELLAEELRQAQHHLAEIVGADSSDELLTRIFSTFCIGK